MDKRLYEIQTRINAYQDALNTGPENAGERMSAARCAVEHHAYEDIKYMLDEINRLTDQLKWQDKYFTQGTQKFMVGIRSDIAALTARVRLAERKADAAATDLKSACILGIVCDLCNRKDTCKKRTVQIGGCKDFEWRGPRGLAKSKPAL